MLGGLLLAVAVSGWFAGFAEDCSQLQQNTLRLHIQANSDQPQDQALKLLVRDAVLSHTQALFAGASSQQQAVELARQNLDSIQQVARRTLDQAGCSLPVQVSVTNMHFSTTVYPAFSLPAGQYDALRIRIGRAEGHNWFCVLYPGLCVPGAQNNQYPTSREQQLVEQSSRYEIRFAALELAQSITRRTPLKTARSLADGSQ